MARYSTIIDEFTSRPVSRQRKWQLRQLKAKRCILCGAQAVNATHCETHRIAHAKGSNVRYHLDRALEAAGV